MSAIPAHLFAPAATLFVGLVAAGVAFWAIRTNRWAARMKATLDLIERLETHDYYQERYRSFRRVRRDPDGMAAIIATLPGPERSLRDDCLDYLNIYEMVALGIREGILDEGFFRRTQEPIVLRDWRAALPLVASLRDGPAGDPTNYSALEQLVVRWDRTLSVAAFRAAQRPADGAAS